MLWELDGEEDVGLMDHVRSVSDGLRGALGVEEQDLCVLLVDDAAMAALNVRWRGEDRPTDVLSFPAGVPPKGAPAALGDVAISLETCARQAASHGWPLAEEVTFLLVHSLCHLLGHDHGAPEEAAAMRLEEDRLLAIVAPGQRRPPTPY